MKLFASESTVHELLADAKLRSRATKVHLAPTCATSLDVSHNQQMNTRRSNMARSPSKTSAASLAVALLVLLASPVLGDDIRYCNMYLVSYLNSTLSLSLYGGNPDSCSSEPGFFYQVEPPVDGKAGTLPGGLRGSGRGLALDLRTRQIPASFILSGTHHVAIDDPNSRQPRCSPSARTRTSAPSRSATTANAASRSLATTQSSFTRTRQGLNSTASTRPGPATSRLHP